MRYKEFAIESYELDEEISLSKHQPAVKNAVIESIVFALGTLKLQALMDPNIYVTAKLQYEKEDTKQLIELLTNYLDLLIGHWVSEKLLDLGKKIEPSLESVKVKMIGVGGYAQGFNIVLSLAMIKKISSQLCLMINEQVLHNYAPGDLINGLMVMIDNAIKTKCAKLLPMGNVEETIDGVAAVFIHELVHIVQHERQKHRFGNFEFRSYLDKEKDEFLNLSRKKNTSSPGSSFSSHLSSDEEKRYNDLYYASPAEISAHAHNIALHAIHNHKLGYAGDSKYDYAYRANHALQNITYYTDYYLKKRYKGQVDRKMQAVYKRYHKLVYQEVYKQIQDTLKKANFKA